MKLNHIIPLAILLALGFGQTVSAQSVDDFVGTYDLNHTAVSVDLELYVTPEAYGTVVIPVAFDIALENEQVPPAVVDYLLDEARAYLEKMGVPEQLEARIIMALDTALQMALDAINEKMVDLPDELALSKAMPKGNLVNGLFSDLDGQGRQFSLPGYLAAETGEFELASIYYGQVDLETSSGFGLFSSGEIDVSQVFKGVKVHVEGMLEEEMELTRLE